MIVVDLFIINRSTTITLSYHTYMNPLTFNHFPTNSKNEIFESFLWENQNSSKNWKNYMHVSYKRAIRILHSAAYRDHFCPLFQRHKVLKLIDLVSLENYLFIHKCLNDNAFSLLSNHFKLTANIYLFVHLHSSESLCNT